MNPLPPPSPQVVRAFALSPFYTQCRMVGPLPIVASRKPSPYALHEAAYLIEKLLAGRRDVLRTLAERKVRVAIMGVAERTCDIPEHADLTPRDYWNRRARGLGATPHRPAVSGAEENLLDLDGDPYAGESIFLHEFSHAVHEMGLRFLDREFDAKLDTALTAAREKGLWKGTYADTNASEYWAEGVQSWFDANQPKVNASHNGIATREPFRDRDPGLAALIAAQFPERRWRWSPAGARRGQGHLKGFDPATAPRFSWG